MNTKLQRLFVAAAVASAACLFTNNVSAQDDASREERRERMIEGYKERLEIKAEADWKEKVRPLVVKVLDAQREARSGFGGGFGGRGGQGGGGGGGGDQANRRGGFGQPNPDFDALRKAIDDKAPADEVKEKLAKYRESRKAKEATLEKTREELRKVLTPRQEAAAVVYGLLQ